MAIGRLLLIVSTARSSRINLHDSTQNANQLTDGTDPTAPLLKNGISLFNPGLSEKRGSTVDYYAPDQLGTTMGVLDSSQVEQTKREYDAFGNLINMTGTVPGGSPNWLVPGYAGADGYQGDPDTGLIRCGNRYYNPYFGRWVTQDPIGAGDNWYAYCGNEPIDQDDPTGLDYADAIRYGRSVGAYPGQPIYELQDGKFDGNVYYMPGSLPQGSGYSQSLRSSAGGGPINRHTTKGITVNQHVANAIGCGVGIVVGVLICTALDIGSEGTLTTTNSFVLKATVNASVGFVSAGAGAVASAQSQGQNPWTLSTLETAGYGAVGGLIFGALPTGPVGQPIANAAKKVFMPGD